MTFNVRKIVNDGVDLAERAGNASATVQATVIEVRKTLMVLLMCLFAIGGILAIVAIALMIDYVNNNQEAEPSSSVPAVDLNLGICDDTTATPQTYSLKAWAIYSPVLDLSTTISGDPYQTFTEICANDAYLPEWFINQAYLGQVLGKVVPLTFGQNYSNPAYATRFNCALFPSENGLDYQQSILRQTAVFSPGYSAFSTNPDLSSFLTSGQVSNITAFNEAFFPEETLSSSQAYFTGLDSGNANGLDCSGLTTASGGTNFTGSVGSSSIPFGTTLACNQTFRLMCARLYLVP